MRVCSGAARSRNVCSSASTSATTCDGARTARECAGVHASRIDRRTTRQSEREAHTVPSCEPRARYRADDRASRAARRRRAAARISATTRETRFAAACARSIASGRASNAHAIAPASGLSMTLRTIVGGRASRGRGPASSEPDCDQRLDQRTLLARTPRNLQVRAIGHFDHARRMMPRGVGHRMRCAALSSPPVRRIRQMPPSRAATMRSEPRTRRGAARADARICKAE